MSRYASWGIILDDLIFPDGRSAMGTLGGGGLYAASGMRLWQQDVTLYAGVGADFDAATLRPHGFDDSGLIRSEMPTPRAWQLLEENGRRTQIPRVSPKAWFGQLVHTPLSQPIPPALKALHFQGRGDAVEEAFTEALAKADVVIGAEPIAGSDSKESELDNLKRCLSHFTIFSPDELGAEILVGKRPAKEQLRALSRLEPQVVALRQGEAGSLIYERDSDQVWCVPAAPAQVVDVTGAGNAYCGGLLVGWLETGDIRQAAAQASVSAAYAIEQIGPPRIDTAVMATARARANEVVHLINKVEE